MVEPHDTAPTPPTAPRIAGLGVFWLGLAGGYLAASASGRRGFALGIVGLMIGAGVAGGGRPLAGLVVGVALAGSCVYWSDALLFFAYLPPIAGFGFMAWFFQRTLAPDTEPLIARVARREHPDLPPEIARYARALTRVWAWCFVCLLAAAIALAPLLPLASWSRWMQLLAATVPAILFLGEYAYRHHRLPGHRHASLPALISNIVAVFRGAALRPTQRGLRGKPHD